MSDNPVRDLAELLKDSGLKVVFGLRAQGHLPTIKAMLAGGASWDQIGEAIGWHAPTARKHYDAESLADVYLAAEHARLREKVEAMLTRGADGWGPDHQHTLSGIGRQAARIAVSEVLAILAESEP